MCAIHVSVRVEPVRGALSFTMAIAPIKVLHNNNNNNNNNNKNNNNNNNNNKIKKNQNGPLKLPPNLTGRKKIKYLSIYISISAKQVYWYGMN